MNHDEKPLFGTYRAVKSEILRRIRIREWPPGTLLPPEVELAQDFGCARATVNRAMRELAEEGIVDRRRRAGTRVNDTLTRRGWLDIPQAKTEIEAMGATYRYALIDRLVENAPSWLCAALSIPSNTQVVHVRALHFNGDRPWHYEDRWINIDVVPQAAHQSFEDIGPSGWLLNVLPFSDAKITFSAAAADKIVASHLDIAEGTPVFQTERITWLEADKPITFTRIHHPSDYRLAMHL